MRSCIRSLQCSGDSSCGAVKDTDSPRDKRQERLFFSHLHFLSGMLPCECAGNPRKCETWPFIYRNKISASRDDGANDVYDDDKDNGSSGGA